VEINYAVDSNKAGSGTEICCFIRPLFPICLC